MNQEGDRWAKFKLAVERSKSTQKATSGSIEKKYAKYLKKGKNKEVYVTDEAAADKIMQEYAAFIQIDPEYLEERDWNTVLRIACNPETGGLDDAMKSLLQEKLDARSAEREAERDESTKNDMAQLTSFGIETLPGGEHAWNILQQCHAQFVSNPLQVNFTYGVPLTAEEVEDVIEAWDTLPGWTTDLERFGNFHCYSPENKQKVGKGNVGDTLDTRTVQADFLVVIGGKKFNCHVNVKKSKK